MNKTVFHPNLKVLIFSFLLAFALESAFVPTLGHAFSDEIYVDTQEVWEAAKLVMEPYGIKKIKIKKGFLESKWVEDVVHRDRGLFKQWAKQRVLRRYRIRVKLQEQAHSVQVSVTGKFQERSADSGPSIPWRSVKPTTEDYEVEKNFFMAILNKLAANRKVS